MRPRTLLGGIGLANVGNPRASTDIRELKRLVTGQGSSAVAEAIETLARWRPATAYYDWRGGTKTRKGRI